MTNQENDFYQNLRVKMQEWLKSEEGQTNKWADYLMMAPDLFHLLCKLVLDKDIPGSDKAKLAGAIAYFMSPVDILPEVLLGPIGLADDIAVAAYVLNSVINHSDPEIIRKHWAGDGEALEIVQQILKVSDQMVGSGLWNKLKKRFK